MRCLLCALPGLVMCFSGLVARAADVESQARPTSAMQLVRQALDADLAGRKNERASLLQQALSHAPLYAPARWHSGQVFVQDGWAPLEQTQRKFSEDRHLREYRQLRDRLDGSADSHAVLARFCRKQQWKDREAFHWAAVLRLRPRDKEATSALHLQEYRGMWLTSDEIARFKEISQQAEAALRHWQPLLAEMHQAIDGDDSQRRVEALQRLEAVHDPAATAALALSLSKASEDYASAVMRALGNISDQAATDALLWQAVASPYDSVRQAAVDELKPRPLHNYVPALMGALTSPLELSYYIQSTEPGSLRHGFMLVRDSPTMEWSFSQSTQRNVFRLMNAPQAAARMQGFQWRNAVRSIARLDQQVASANQVTQLQNDRVCSVLEQTTGKSMPSTPQAWWKWWDDHNELALAERKSRCHYCMPVRRSSCFIQGTPVWTEAGLEPIERLRPGDRVVSQDPETGELSLKCIKETTLRAPSPTLRVQVDSHVVVATRGHPFWAAGKGWRMAKELSTEDKLHTLSGAAAVTSIAEGPDLEAYNLVVDGFGTYFVGKAGLLVRDNTLRQVPTAPLPGYNVVARAETR